MYLYIHVVESILKTKVTLPTLFYYIAIHCQFTYQPPLMDAHKS